MIDGVLRVGDQESIQSRPIITQATSNQQTATQVGPVVGGAHTIPGTAAVPSEECARAALGQNSDIPICQYKQERLQRVQMNAQQMQHLFGHATLSEPLAAQPQEHLQPLQQQLTQDKDKSQQAISNAARLTAAASDAANAPAAESTLVRTSCAGCGIALQFSITPIWTTARIRCRACRFEMNLVSQTRATMLDPAAVPDLKVAGLDAANAPALAPTNTVMELQPRWQKLALHVRFCFVLAVRQLPLTQNSLREVKDSIEQSGECKRLEF